MESGFIHLSYVFFSHNLLVTESEQMIHKELYFNAFFPSDFAFSFV